MGSELIDDEQRVVWGMNLGLIARQVILRDTLSRIALKGDGSDDGIRASRLVGVPVMLPLLTSIEPYSKLEARLRGVALRPEAVTTFAYDWRRSIVDAAQQLARVADRHLAAWLKMWDGLPVNERHHLPKPKVTVVAHSMGGLVARWFSEVGGGRELLSQL